MLRCPLAITSQGSGSLLRAAAEPGFLHERSHSLVDLTNKGGDHFVLAKINATVKASTVGSDLGRNQQQQE
jgi:hypothetical protein